MKVPNQSYRRILDMAISQEPIYESAQFFAYFDSSKVKVDFKISYDACFCYLKNFLSTHTLCGSF